MSCRTDKKKGSERGLSGSGSGLGGQPYLAPTHCPSFPLGPDLYEKM